MKTLILNNGQLEQKEVNNTLESLQEIVGGYIEIPFLSKVFFENDIDMIINEEGKYIEGLKPEIAIVSKDKGNIIDLVYGTCIFASHDKYGETVALNLEQAEIIKKELKDVILTHQDTGETQFIKALLV
jgi:hypothetical protein